MTVLFAALLAAIMSTADSALLSISSMFTKNLYGPLFREMPSEERLTRVGKACSWTLLVAMSLLAIALRRNTTLVTLLDRKFDLLAQLAPGFLGGIWLRRSLSGVATGMLLGVVVSLGLAMLIESKPWGIHAGVYGLLVNVAVVSWATLRAR